MVPSVSPRQALQWLFLTLQFALAFGGGAWAGHASDPSGWGAWIGAIGMGLGLLGAYAGASVVALVFAPVVMAQLLRNARASHDPRPQDIASRHDVVGIAMTLGVMAVAIASAVAIALLVWLQSDTATLLGAQLAFLPVAFGVALLAPGARRVVV